MSLRRFGIVLGLAALAACRPSVGERSSPSNVDYAVFDPSTSRIPQPNDLALQSAASLPAGAQKEFLALLAAAGGFPNDQEVPIQIQFVRQAVGGAAAPLALDPASIKLLGAVAPGQATVAVMRVDATPPAPVAVDSAYDANTGTLTLRNKVQSNGSRAWPPGARYAVFVLGGASGVKSQDGGTVEAMPTFAILRGAIVNDLSLTDPANQALLPGTTEEKAAAGAQLEQIRLAYTNLVPLATAIGMPMASVIDLQTFGIAPLSATNPTVVAVDSSAGRAPLPFDPLIDPATGKIALNPAFGAAAAGLATLDGFSTTAMILALTARGGDAQPVDAATVNATTVFLYKLGATPARLSDVTGALQAGKPGDAAYVTEPPQIQVGCAIASGHCSTAIGLQPAVPAPVPQLSTTLYLPPLDEKTTYAVVVTDGVKDVTGKPLGRSTFAEIVLDVQSPVFANGASQLAGVSDALAQSIEQMRTALVPVYGALPGGLTKDHVAMAYTFRTQSISGTSLALSAAPYSVEAGAAQALFTPDAAPTPIAAPSGIPTTNVAGFFDVRFKSVDAIDKTTGALRPTLATDLASATTLPTLLTELHALVAVPDASVVPTCPAPFPAGARCARLVVFGHGLYASKEALFTVASSLASAGFVAAAIDFPFHGARNWCRADSDCGGGGTCDKSGAFAQSAGQGDCGSLDPTSAECTGLRPGVCTGGTGPVLADPRFFLTQNFFRMRDAFRQNLLDQSALALALARPPSGVPQPAQNPFTAVLPAGVVVDPTEVYYESISLGSISGTSVLATNPRITRGSLSVGGGTFVDVGITSPTFQVALAPLFTLLLADVLNGATFSFDMVDPTNPAFNPAVAAGFLQIVNVAKWVMDPGDPINYARNVKGAPLPNLLANANGSVAQPAKAVYGQIADGDTVVPNPTNWELYSLIMGGTPAGNELGGVTFYTGPGAIHGMLETQAQVQADAVGFLLNPASPPPTTRNLP
jgi:hypothetical protein